MLFAFWGAEELGLLGSTHFVSDLSEEERDKIALNLNYDMIVMTMTIVIRLLIIIIIILYYRDLRIMPDRYIMDQE